ncbi:hypothetical protein [Psychrobacillus sp. FSL K6-1464]|uniref:hypothetical protein n=1 Tax=Psychrobacillus sp. FSL K6-1464 TaxID=2921545 RepID=UPI0030F59136
MASSREEIKGWLERGLEQRSTHVIIAVDTWDHEDYPVYVHASESVREKADSYDGSEDRIMEVYDLSKDINEQLNETRSWNFGI